ncbi:GCG_CRPN prefix-to-repeats domain-containing protein [Methylobacterium oxalidis]|uniref:GCG_CRPN prefix-to-repeats domain-containing protein n=1 Tax=Methylobacterium oxalidis TaxID=944322 RepID=UPI003315E8C8
MSKRWMLGLGAALALGGLGAVSTARAAPLGVGTVDGLTGATPLVEQVAQGCGPGWGRGAYGRCRPFAGPGRVYGPRPFYGRRCFLRPTPFGPRRVCRW